MEQNVAKKRVDFVIRIVAPGLKPWGVAFRSLSRVLDAAQRLIEQREESDDPEGQERDDALAAERVLRLVDVKTGSAAYRVAVPNPESALKLIAATGRGIEEPKSFEWTPATLSAFKDLSEVAKSMNCTIEFRSPGAKGYGPVLATITPGTYAVVSRSAFITGHTSVYAKIERVGGATEMHCGIRLVAKPRKMVVCRVQGEDLVRELGQYIYQNVMLTGLATWHRSSMRLKTIDISGFDPPKKGTFMEAIDDLRVLTNGAWDRVGDPVKYLAEIRGE